MKKIYVTPSVDISKLNLENIICTSPGDIEIGPGSGNAGEMESNDRTGILFGSDSPWE